LLVRVGGQTEFGKLSRRLELRPPETEFETGVRRFGYLLMEVTMALLVVIFAINVFFKHHVLEAFLFALALAVGLTPQSLPAIISVNLARGAKRMAARKVIVRRLSSIQNFGSMNVLCSDKTGTLTEGIVTVHAALNPLGNPSESTLLAAQVNASLQAGFTNPIDQAIRDFRPLDVSAYDKQDEIPYDFVRKRLSVLVKHAGQSRLISKGAVDNILAVCTRIQRSDGSQADLVEHEEAIRSQYRKLSGQGFRTLGVAERLDGAANLVPGTVNAVAERDMVFLGFLVLHDPPKPGIIEAISRLSRLGVSLKMITGDNRHVAEHVAQTVGLRDVQMLTGDELHQLSDEALLHRARATTVFPEIEPNQKERIIVSLKKAGEVVGYIGDGINDATALHAADVGISAAGAVDVAKEAADIVLLEHDLDVLVDGVGAGRETFANTLKYVFMATSANFGNMFSMAGASLFLPFLPLLPKQILLTNLLTDFPEMAIAHDRVDEELLAHPRRWDIGFIRRFMMVFGTLSSVFDFVTFGTLLAMKVTHEQFRTGWFLESVVSASLVVLVVRTRRPFWRSPPGRLLFSATMAIVCATIVLSQVTWARFLGFAPLPWHIVGMLLAIVAS
jgi:Mg2+-importing ATPase